ncbi:sigma-70 family RNA polymerase sigma factor [Candidatus Woesebacteria bacterium]|nr:sigma-70 family RNA polymerase sigma factor [Candidatus Woesebacteria bacterium]
MSGERITGRPVEKGVLDRVYYDKIKGGVWSQLTDLQAAIWILLEEGLSQAEIARHFGMTRQSVGGSLKGIRTKVRELPCVDEPDSSRITKFGRLRKSPVIRKSTPPAGKIVY